MLSIHDEDLEGIIDNIIMVKHFLLVKDNVKIK